MDESFIKDFSLKKFDTNESCLAHILETKYPKGIFCKKCKQTNKFYKVKSRPVYQCSCGYQIAPLTGTIFERSTTPLLSWFHCFSVVYKAKNTVSAKQIQRELRVTYKTAWRMKKQVKNLIDNIGNFEDNGQLLTRNGIVEVNDEHFRLGQG